MDLIIASVKLLLLFTILLWYEGTLINILSKQPLQAYFFSIITPFLRFCIIVISNVVWFVPNVMNLIVRASRWRFYSYLMWYGEFLSIIQPVTWLASLTKNVNTNFHSFTLTYIAYFNIWLVSITIFIDYCYYNLLYLLDLVVRFLKLALFSIYVTWVLINFTYKITFGVPLYPKTKPKKTLYGIYLIVGNFLKKLVLDYSISIGFRVFWWRYSIENFTDSFFFLNRFYRINDLLWQDGFLFDFLQKKVVDRWVRTFVIYSGYLFSERLWFDYVVRFYIDLVIWPGHRYSIYEFTSIATTLVSLVSLLIFLFYIVFLYYFFLIIL